MLINSSRNILIWVRRNGTSLSWKKAAPWRLGRVGGKNGWRESALRQTGRIVGGLLDFLAWFLTIYPSCLECCTRHYLWWTKPNQSSSCKMRIRPENTEENLSHALIYCESKEYIGHQLLSFLRTVEPSWCSAQAGATSLGEHETTNSLDALNYTADLRQSSTRVRPDTSS